MGATLRAAHPVGGAAHPGRAAVEDVGVDHRRGDVAVPEEFFSRADVVPVLEQVGRERVALPSALGIVPSRPGSEAIVAPPCGSVLAGLLRFAAEVTDRMSDELIQA